MTGQPVEFPDESSAAEKETILVESILANMGDLVDADMRHVYADKGALDGEISAQLDSEWKSMESDDQKAFYAEPEIIFTLGPSYDDLESLRWMRLSGIAPPRGVILPDPLPEDLSGEEARALLLGCLDVLLQRLVGFGGSSCKFSGAGAPPHLVDVGAVSLIGDQLSEQLDRQRSREASPVSPTALQFNQMVLLRLARLNISWIAAQMIVLAPSRQESCTKLGKVLLAYMELDGSGLDAVETGRLDAIRNEAACGYGAGIAVFLGDPLERAVVAAQLLQQETSAGWHKNLVSLVLTNLSSAPVLRQILPGSSDATSTDAGKASAADSVCELVEAALRVITKKHESWTAAADVPVGEDFTTTAESVQLADGWSWCGKRDSDMTVSEEGMKVAKTNDNHDYSIALGTAGFTTGQHEWSMRILDDIDGVTVGVCSADVKLDKCISHDRQGKVWYWNPHGGQGSIQNEDSVIENEDFSTEE